MLPKVKHLTAFWDENVMKLIKNAVFTDNHWPVKGKADNR